MRERARAEASSAPTNLRALHSLVGGIHRAELASALVLSLGPGFPSALAPPPLTWPIACATTNIHMLSTQKGAG